MNTDFNQYPKNRTTRKLEDKNIRKILKNGDSYAVTVSIEIIMNLNGKKAKSLPRQFIIIFTYLLKSEKDGSYYTGITENCEDRIAQHNGGKVESTKNKRSWKLVYRKPHASHIEARKHEKWLKKKNRQYKNKLAG